MPEKVASMKISVSNDLIFNDDLILDNRKIPVIQAIDVCVRVQAIPNYLLCKLFFCEVYKRCLAENKKGTVFILKLGN